MSKARLFNKYEGNTKVSKISDNLLQLRNKLHIRGLIGSSLSFVTHALYKKTELPFLLILENKEEAAYYLNDLEQMAGEKDVLFYPGSYRRPYQIEETDNANILLRAEVLNRINSRKRPAIIVTYPEALFEKVITRKELDSNTLKVAVEDKISMEFINEVLFEYEFKRVDFITEPGEFSVRGGIVDVFSFSNENPYRIEFFGNEVDSIRTFDVETQLSIEKKKKITIIPNVENKFFRDKRESFLDYISDKTAIFIQNTESLQAQLDKLFERAIDAFAKLEGGIKHVSPEELFSDSKAFMEKAELFTVAELGSKSYLETKSSYEFSIQPQPSSKVKKIS